MLEEGSGTMEKKASTRQSQGHCKISGVTGERKSDSTSNRHGFNRRSISNGGAKAQDNGQAPRPLPIQKCDRSYGDKRQRQRSYPDNRQREKVVEEDGYSVISTSSRKGNANHLLNFKLYPYRSQGNEHRQYSRSSFSSHGHGGYRKATRYKKEQFLQASCQFVVRDTGDYTEQAVNSDALVDWKLVELVRGFSTEPVTCPICLQIPAAGKITKCGHTYCWACILHYIKLGEKELEKCPICYETIELNDLKSIQWMDVPDYNIGDEIDMRLMRKSKGSTFAVPKNQWEDRQGKPLYIQEGENTKYVKLLLASCDQIKADVIEIERTALTVQIDDAEDSEVPFIEMALQDLTTREKSLQQLYKQTSEDKSKVYLPGLGSVMVNKPKEKPQDTGIDAHLDEAVPSRRDEKTVKCNSDEPEELAESRDDRKVGAFGDVEPRWSDGSALKPDIEEDNSLTCLLEEGAECMGLPADEPHTEKQAGKTHTLNTKDDYFFYQAVTGQHIYLSSLNAQCLAREYDSLEESPDSIKGTIVAIDRIFMTEDVRKRLRYLGHIPLTCEFYIIELKFQPQTISKDTLKHFEASFERKRKLRQQKANEDKRRARKHELEERKSYGLYPEMNIPLDSHNQFPSPLSASLEESFSENMFPQVSDSPQSSSILNQDTERRETMRDHRRMRHDSTTSEDSANGSMSFAQMLRAGKTTQLGGGWGRPNPPHSLLRSSSDDLPTTRSSQGRRGDEDSDGEGMPAPSYSASMSDAIAKALDGIDLHETSSAGKAKEPQTGKGGRKKRKEKKILFSTAMARNS